MAQITDIDPNSNEFFFISGLRDNTLKAGKNSFVVNTTPRITSGQNLLIRVTDSQGNELSITKVKTGVDKENFFEFRETYAVTVPETAKVGIGRIEIRGVGVDLGDYTGSYAFFRGNAYPISDSQKLPLLRVPPGSVAFPTADIVWSRNLLVDSDMKTDSEVRFFELPYIDVKPLVFNPPAYPTASYRMASGSCSGIAVSPNNNASRTINVENDKPLYEVYFSSGSRFESMMVGENIRIKNPVVKSFTYANYSNNQINYGGILNTDFIAKIERVVSDTSVLISIPFATVSDLVTRTRQNLFNEDSIYNKNNLVDPFGYNISDDSTKQTSFYKKNFYILSIGAAEFEVIYKSIPTVLSKSTNTLAKKSLVDIEFNHLRTYCGDIASYRIYGRSLNSPETSTLLVEGKVLADENITSLNFNNGLYQSAGHFYDRTHTNRFWLTSSVNVMFSQSNAVLMGGVRVGHSGNSAGTDYVIFKDDTTGTARTAAYVNYNFVSRSYWYGTSEAFLSFAAMPTASYLAIPNISLLSAYTGSQENATISAIHDSNPIKLRQSTLYSFSMRVRPFANNTSASKLYVYFVSGNFKKQIALIDNTFKSITDELFSATFFSDTVQYGTIMLTPISGDWFISGMSLKPYQARDYSVDSFKVRVPIKPFVKNELFEIEAELYDGFGRLAYGQGSYNFNYNKMFSPLKAQLFMDPGGIINN